MLGVEVCKTRDMQGDAVIVHTYDGMKGMVGSSPKTNREI